MAKKQQAKVVIRIGEPISQDVFSTESGVLVVRKGTIITREMLTRLANWIVEEEERIPVEREKRVVSAGNNEAILRKLDFEEVVSEKTREEVEKNAGALFSSLGKNDDKIDMAGLEDAIALMVSEAPDNPDVPLKLFEMKQRASQIHKHSVNCSIIASFIAKALNYPPREAVEFSLSMMLHDIGVLSFPQELLELKRHLTKEDWDLIKQHPARGWEMLKRVPGIEPMTQMVVLGHHVKADGLGYPIEIDFHDLPPQAHLALIINHFENLTSSRPDRKAYISHDAIKILLANRSKYHPSALESFVRVVGFFPISTFVRLNSNEIGVVVRNNPDNLFLPEVKLVIDPAGAHYSKEIIVNLLNEPDRKIMNVETTV
ncbi:MAG: HD domain-containing phosphohydrolase [bacterium]